MSAPRVVEFVVPRSGSASGAVRVSAGAVAADTGVEEKEQLDVRTALERPWNVVVWDDPINLMDYVVYVFQRLFGMSIDEATRHMLEVHNEGRSIVASSAREKAEYYVTRLHGYGLKATIERVDADAS